MKRFGLVVAFILACSPVQAFVETGYANDSSEIRSAMSRWRLKMVSTRGLNDRQYEVSNRTRIGSHSYERSDIVTKAGNTYGAFISCIPVNPKNKIRFAYSYGEPSISQAKEKCVYAFAGMPGSEGYCKSGSVVILEDKE